MSGTFLTLDGVPGIFVVWKGEIVPLISPCLNQPGLQDCPTRCRSQHCHFSRHKWNRVPRRTSAKHMTWLGMWPKLCVWSWTPLILSRPQPAVYIRLRNVVPEFLGNSVNLSHQYCPTHIPYVGPPPGVIELVVWKLRAQLDDPCFLGAHILILSPFKWRGQTIMKTQLPRPADSQLILGLRTWFQGQEGHLQLLGDVLSLSLFPVVFLRTGLQLMILKPQKPRSFPRSPDGACSLLSLPAHTLTPVYSLGWY